MPIPADYRVPPFLHVADSKRVVHAITNYTGFYGSRACSGRRICLPKTHASSDSRTVTCAKCRTAMRDRALDAQQQALRSAAAATKRAARRAREADVWGKIDQPEVPDA